MTDGFCVVIPVYNHERTVADVVRRTLDLGLPVIVVDDGSTDASYERIKDMAGIRILRHRPNRGKGAALMTGFLQAEKTFVWAITLDADGQHDPRDAKSLMAAIPPEVRPIVVGCRQNMRAAAAPLTSRFGRGFSNFWVRISGGPAVTDSQSGFRVYPLPESLHLGTQSRRFQFEVEILVGAKANGIPVIEAPVSVSYQPGTPRISHFHPVEDFLRNFGLFSRLITGRVVNRIFRSKKMTRPHDSRKPRRGHQDCARGAEGLKPL
ncbi:MAG: glycosyltransferase family 2 protein [Desulfobacterales bacterium]